MRWWPNQTPLISPVPSEMVISRRIVSGRGTSLMLSTMPATLPRWRARQSAMASQPGTSPRIAFARWDATAPSPLVWFGRLSSPMPSGLVVVAPHHHEVVESLEAGRLDDPCDVAGGIQQPQVASAAEGACGGDEEVDPGAV